MRVLIRHQKQIHSANDKMLRESISEVYDTNSPAVEVRLFNFYFFLHDDNEVFYITAYLRKLNKRLKVYHLRDTTFHNYSVKIKIAALIINSGCNIQFKIHVYSSRSTDKQYYLSSKVGWLI